MVLMKQAFEVPYSKAEIDSANKWADNQAVKIVKDIYNEAPDLKKAYANRPKGELESKEIVALISYLQRLGTDIKTTEIKTASNN